MNAISNKCDLESPTRNNYFYGKRLDEYHFQLETDYFNKKRELINRCVHGVGVVCGLDVSPCTNDSVLIQPGLALDCDGKEIVVPIPYKLKFMSEQADADDCPEEDELEAVESGGYRKGDYARGKIDQSKRMEKWFKVYLCYKECLDEPEVVHTSDHCNTCSVQPSTIKEGFEIIAEAGKFDSPYELFQKPDVIKEIQGAKGDSPQRIYDLCYWSLVKKVVSQPCCRPSNKWDPCIPLANVRMIRDGDSWRIADQGIDIRVRPIVLSNENLFQLVLSMILDH